MDRGQRGRLAGARHDNRADGFTPPFVGCPTTAQAKTSGGR
ncbi:hypothetical protein I553_4875 [Mycobacterium xenopi 4042]|uniref:Uncharacterized protein n=1 Tax=Mycobacterium xenopi 4042 TaxID=1299334 RepID=X8AHW2_MYCXE|nr:hypothetical protein I553_4875 [Mycobacterium xenopi 4042]